MSSSDSSASRSLPHSPSPEPEWFAVVRSYVESLRYGIVQLVVHDGRVTQIERTEKVRLPSPGAPAAGDRPS